jgi:predicted small lipoprotein YifL
MRTALIALLALGVCLAGCGKKPLIADPKAEKKNPEPTKAIPANIVDSIVEKEIRRILKKPEGELTKANLEQVTEIDLGGTEITDAGLKEVAKLQQLTSLDLAGCEQITDAGLKEVAQHKQLISLGLPPKITGASLKGVAKLQ